MSTTWWRTSTKILRSSERVYMHAWSVLYVQTAVNVVKTCGDNRTSCRRFKYCILNYYNRYMYFNRRTLLSI